jgi:hypothetical protein
MLMIISIYRDSDLYGTHLGIQEQTNGASYRVSGAREEDLAFFTQLTQYDYVYSQGNIYVTIKSKTNANTETTLFPLLDVVGKINENDPGRLYLYDMSHLGEDPSLYAYAYILLYFIFLVACVTALIIKSAYDNHMEIYKSDIVALRTIGAMKSQIYMLLGVELAVSFVAAACAAISFSSLIMFVLFKSFLHTKNVGNLAWLIFHINPLSVAVIMTYFALIIALLSGFSIAKALGANIKKTHKQSERRRNLWIASKSFGSVSLLLTKILKTRASKQLARCLFISMPATMIVVFLFNFLFTAMGELNVPPNYDLRLSVNDIGTDALQLTEYDVQFINSLEGVGNVTQLRSYDGYILTSEPIAQDELVRFDTENHIMAAVFPQRESSEDIPTLSRNRVAINKNYANTSFRVGDEFYLYIYTEGQGYLSYDKLVVSELLDLPWAPRILSVYMNDSQFEEMAKDARIISLYVTLADVRMSIAVEESLRNRFNEQDFFLLNNRIIYEHNVNSAKGFYLMGIILSVILVVFVAIILYVKLRDYINGQFETIKSFYKVGAAKTDLFSAYANLTFTVSVIGIFVSFSIPIVVFLILLLRSGYKIRISIVSLFIQILLAAVVLFSYNYPTRKAMKSILKGM